LKYPQKILQPDKTTGPLIVGFLAVPRQKGAEGNKNPFKRLYKPTEGGGGGEARCRGIIKTILGRGVKELILGASRYSGESKTVTVVDWSHQIGEPPLLRR